ncbi:Polyisoprenoid-binding protein YceI [Chitinophaga terrae (ex Kim and Jung 2007)]|uniref:Polyisoprenoid-binding protein YceI n=1 Tax=Chitinophaga terrae (ex Kim and Jung 2007) TaxID=408074 RepID=A0A1H4FMH4_9BACT|nr:YceI family protein [Chitinophaga terrae (ex Kim and Jung 2007)]MDQ0108743.1 polyisoprenoid-binding protein YceI [Chitinophaga terrae (ex Kim and Jung 2007)]GEP89025.1 lipid-binding protein [Chitinophaga terrae (ex Kim and Jung 2007)]SEA98030.1 Polyisoprenoid-binding protein YceI [Chitinophaga terrae (ex Kim and Jung 2007)]
MQRLVSLLFIGSSVFLLSFTTPANNNEGNKPARSVTARKAAVFQVSTTDSKVNWTGKKVTGQHEGTINITDGKLELDNNVLKNGNFTLDTRSIVVTDIKDASGNAKLLGHLKSDDFFSVEKFPTATLATTSISNKGNGNYEITGNLTIKGITNPVSFPATVTVAGNKLTAKAKVTIDRTKYNIKYGSKSFFEGIGDKAIYDDFDLDVVLVANLK